MSEKESATLRSVCWAEVFPWLNIFRSFRLAVTLRLLVLGAAAITLTLGGWAVFAWMFGVNPQFAGCSTASSHGYCISRVVDNAVPSKPVLPLLDRLPSEPSLAQNNDPSYPFFGVWAELSAPIWTLFTRSEMTTAIFACLVLSSLWSLAVWAFFGGAITRIAAVQLASDERVGWGAAMRWAMSKWLAYFAAPLFPLLGVFLAVIPLLLLGLILRADLGLVVGALVWPLALLGGLIMAMLLLGLIFGWPLMWATISTEGTDSFDAMSRTYAYVFQRPLRYLFYAIVAAIFGWLGWILVQNFAAAIISLAAWGASWGSGSARMTDIMSGTMDARIGQAGANLMHFWTGCVKWLALGYVYSYFWTASTVIYLLLRRDVDATEMDEVFLEADESERNFGLPPMTTDEVGAPEIADTGANASSNGDKDQDAPTEAKP